MLERRRESAGSDHSCSARNMPTQWNRRTAVREDALMAGLLFQLIPCSLNLAQPGKSNPLVGTLRLPR
jgi:hypothetical protein